MKMPGGGGGRLLLSPPTCPTSAPCRNMRCTPSLPPSGGFLSAASSLHARSLSSVSRGDKGRRAVITRVIPFLIGNASQQPPPDLPSYLFRSRIVYMGMPLVASVTELLLAEFLYLKMEDDEKPVFLYINSTGTTKDGSKLGYESEALAIYDTMRFVKLPIYTLCVGNAWGEAALLLAAGEKGNRAALPSSSIMIKQPIGRYQGQGVDLENANKELTILKKELVMLLAKHTGKPEEQIEEDMRRPKYFSPAEAVEYGIIDKVLDTEKKDGSGFGGL